MPRHTLVRSFPILIIAVGLLVFCLQLGALYSVFWFRSRVLIDTHAPPSQELPQNVSLAARSLPRPIPDSSPGAPSHPQVPGSVTPKPPPELEQRIRALNEEALRFEAQGEFGLARKALLEAEKLNPNDPPTLVNLARLAEAENRQDVADPYWKRLVELGPSAGDPYWLAKHRISQRLAQSNRTQGPLFLVGTVQRSVFEKNALRERFALYLPIRLARQGHPIDPGRLALKLYFYDQLPDGRIVPTKAKLLVRFENPRPTWTQGGVEVLSAIYEADRSQRGEGQFYGYVFRIYYEGVLQDEWAEPAQLRFQVPYTTH
ncbi:tetratricopeptide repeat protein [Candidatus Methylacidithermus pantelleriae]|uniref:tetratricopeptide repeat protein n=1 Tax=Candidatus Methylacidithermus pantelleriae TaxID=2744239 RepID=UPI001BD24C51|nr:hypothetical protein [Candidatus Methylacidithermus pantelleriae]